MSELRELANFICRLDLREVPSDVVAKTKTIVADVYASAIGAINDDGMKNAIAAICASDGTEGTASVWGTEKKTSLPNAIFCNAMLSHFLELDDVHPASKAHIGTVVIPVAATLAKYLGRSGAEFLEAVICGYEVESRIGMALGVKSHREKGWHVTGTAGSFGAAAAAGKLLKLDAEQMVSALGMAATQSAGLWAFLGDGASCKPVNPANAARGGYTAAVLASGGMTGPEHALTAEDGGLLQAMSDNYYPSLVSKDLGTVYEILKVEAKPYPCCRSTHGAIDAVLKLKEENTFDCDQVKDVRIRTYEIGYKQCAATEEAWRPQTVAAAKFSLPYTVAHALVNGEVSMNSFREDQLQSAKILLMAQKVSVEADPEITALYPKHWSTDVTINFTDGRALSAHVTDPYGSNENPMDENAMKNKGVPLLAEYYGDKAEEILSYIATIDSKDRVEL